MYFLFILRPAHFVHLQFTNASYHTYTCAIVLLSPLLIIIVQQRATTTEKKKKRKFAHSDNSTAQTLQLLQHTTVSSVAECRIHASTTEYKSCLYSGWRRLPFKFFNLIIAVVSMHAFVTRAISLKTASYDTFILSLNCRKSFRFTKNRPENPFEVSWIANRIRVHRSRQDNWLIGNHLPTRQADTQNNDVETWHVSLSLFSLFVSFIY